MRKIKHRLYKSINANWRGQNAKPIPIWKKVLRFFSRNFGSIVNTALAGAAVWLALEANKLSKLSYNLSNKVASEPTEIKEFKSLLKKVDETITLSTAQSKTLSDQLLIVSKQYKRDSILRFQEAYNNLVRLYTLSRSIDIATSLYRLYESKNELSFYYNINNRLDIINQIENLIQGHSNNPELFSSRNVHTQWRECLIQLGIEKTICQTQKGQGAISQENITHLKVAFKTIDDFSSTLMHYTTTRIKEMEQQRGFELRIIH